MLARREHGREELKRKLITKGCEAAVATEVAAALEAERLLSDDRFVEALVRARRDRGYGPLRILRELEEKGVAPEIGARVVDAACDWLAEARRVYRKRFGAKLAGSFPERARQARFLQYRGFTFEQIQKILNSREAD
jgi:regulatory protein